MCLDKSCWNADKPQLVPDVNASINSPPTGAAQLRLPLNVSAILHRCCMCLTHLVVTQIDTSLQAYQPMLGISLVSLILQTNCDQ